MVDLTCARCNVEYQGHKLSRYCSKKCRETMTGTCSSCGAGWVKSRKRVGVGLCWPCARKSSGKINAAHAAKRRAVVEVDKPITLPHVLICTHCREPFLSERRGKKYCTKRCSKEVQAIRLGYRNRACRDCGEHLGYKSLALLCTKCRRAGQLKSHAINKHIKRARHYGVHYEPVSRLAVFERDHWLCGICGDLVDKLVEYPDPQSASLDHVIPLSIGGEHTMDNTQISHLSCNVRKGNLVNRAILRV